VSCHLRSETLAYHADPAVEVSADFSANAGMVWLFACAALEYGVVIWFFVSAWRVSGSYPAEADRKLAVLLASLIRHVSATYRL